MVEIGNELPSGVILDVQGDEKLQEGTIFFSNRNFKKKKAGNAALRRTENERKTKNGKKPTGSQKMKMGKTTPIGLLDSKNHVNKEYNAPKGPSKYPYHLKLHFHERPFSLSDIRKLHPGMAGIKITRPVRPPSARWVMLKFPSEELREEVRDALHGHHKEPFKGKLKCYYPKAELLSDVPNLKKTHMNKKELIHTLIVHDKLVKKQPVTEDLKLNSTERELRIRYGIIPSI